MKMSSVKQSVKQKCCDLLQFLYDSLKKEKDNAEVSHAGFVLGDYVYEYDSDGLLKLEYLEEELIHYKNLN